MGTDQVRALLRRFQGGYRFRQMQFFFATMRAPDVRNE